MGYIPLAIALLIFSFVAGLNGSYSLGKAVIRDEITYSCTNFHKYEVKEGVWITCEVVK